MLAVSSWLLALCVACAGCAAPPLPPAAPEPLPADAKPAVTQAAGDERTKLWRADLDSFSQLFHNNFAGAFVSYPQAEFERDMAALSQRVPAASDSEILYALKAMSARTQCGHAGAEPQRGALLERRMPYVLRVFADGVYIVGTDEANKELLGAQVVGVGKVVVAEALERACAYTPSESDSWARMRAPDQLCKAPALAVMGLAETGGAVALAVRDRSGSERTVTLRELPEGSWPTVPLVSAADPRAPITWRQRASWYGSEWLDADKRLLYVWYDRCADQEGRSVKQFAAETLERIDKEKPTRVIVDLRRNSGGNSALLGPFIAGLAARPSVNRPGALAVLIGGGTFSSGAMNAEELRAQTKAVFIGEASGSRPRAWMEVRSIVLPNSLVRVNYMLRAPRWNEQTPASFQPDIPVQARLQDMLRYGDPSLEAAVKLPFAQGDPTP